MLRADEYAYHFHQAHHINLSEYTLASSVAVTFEETVNSTYGGKIKLAGSIYRLGDGNNADAMSLSEADYTSSDNVWFVTVNLPIATVFQYKYINVASDRHVTWEAGPSQIYTVSATSATAMTIHDTWQN